jgi:hypothetical protein
MRLASLKIAVAAAVASVGLSGCLVAPVAPGEVVATAAPPPVQYEAVGIAPAPGYFWVGGSWFWTGGRYAWRGGYWQAPRPGYHYVPNAWVRQRDGWHSRPGHWERGR